MMRAAILGAAVLAWRSVSLGGELVKVTVSERAGVARQAEPITNGVPFPEGAVKDAGALALVGPDGTPVPAAFTAINLWPKDRSVRWALLDTQVNVPAKGAKEFAVVTGAPAALAARLTVEDGKETVTVTTGPLKFVVRKKGFRLFEAAWLDESGAGRFDDAHTLLVAPAEGLAMTVKGVRFTSAADGKSTVVVEERNPMRVALLATGKLTAPDGSTGYDYAVRIHAYAGSTRVKVVPTVIKKYGHPRDVKHFIADLSLGLTLAPAGPLTYALGGEGAPATGTLRAGQTAHVLVETSDRWVLGGAASGSGKAKSTKPLTLGWGDLAGSRVGVAVGVYRFWQTFPKAIEVNGDGAIAVGLYPKRVGKALQFFTGMARTHEVLVVFHGKSAADLQNVFVGLQEPLFAAAPPTWYARTGALGSIAAAGTKLAGDGTAVVKGFDERIAGYFHRLMTVHQDNWSKRGVTMDAYGWLAYGDTLHWVWHDKGTEGTPWDIAWDSNYYDLPHLACLYFARTGEREFFEFFADHTWHLMDIDVSHWHPSFPQGGASRRCPATNHVGYDPPDHTSPIINVAFDHHKSESLFERYYLLGDRRARKVAMDLLGHALRAKNADYGGTRKPGHQIITLVAGYWCTGDRTYLERAKKVIDEGVKRQDRFDGGFNKRPNFTDGILLEGFAKYYQATGDEAVLKSIRRACDWLAGTRRPGSNCAFAYALVWKKIGEAKYLTQALRCLETGRPGHISKDMGSMYRNTPNVTGLLAVEN